MQGSELWSLDHIQLLRVPTPSNPSVLIPSLVKPNLVKLTPPKPKFLASFTQAL